MTGLLEGCVTLITGASSGIGRATALEFARAGSALVCADRQRAPREGGTPTADLINDTGGRAVYIECDVTKADDRARAVAAAADLGGPHVLVNNAGVFRANDFLTTTEADYDQMFEVNSRAPFFVAQLAARAMIERGIRGSIVNLSSVAGLQGTAGFTLYCMTKAAVRLMTYALADELGPQGIRVNALHPGFIDTAMTNIDIEIVGTAAADEYLATIPLRRVGTAEDVARAALVLASPLTDYVSGSSLLVDGGRMRF